MSDLWIYYPMTLAARFKHSLIAMIIISLVRELTLLVAATAAILSLFYTNKSVYVYTERTFCEKNPCHVNEKEDKKQ